MARRKPGSARRWDRKTIRMMQGLAFEIRDPGNAQPPVDPIAWVMSSCGLSLQSVKYLARGMTTQGQKPAGNYRELHEDFAAAFGDLAEACSRNFYTIIEDIANDAKNTAPADRFKTAKWCHELINPGRHEANKIAVEVSSPDTAGDASDHDPRIWEIMTEAENDTLAHVLKQIEDLEASRDEILAGVARRLD